MTCVETVTYEACQGSAAGNGGNDNFNKVIWLAEPNEIYYILIHGSYPMQDFVLSYSTEAFAVNTNCNAAAVLQPPFLGQAIDPLLLQPRHVPTKLLPSI